MTSTRETPMSLFGRNECGKITIKQRELDLCFILHFTYWGGRVRTQRTPPPCLGAWWRFLWRRSAVIAAVLASRGCCRLQHPDDTAGLPSSMAEFNIRRTVTHALFRIFFFNCWVKMGDTGDYGSIFQKKQPFCTDHVSESWWCVVSYSTE